MTATEVLTWVAFGKRLTWEQLSAGRAKWLSRWELLRFGADQPENLRTALEARGAQHPFCPVWCVVIGNPRVEGRRALSYPIASLGPHGPPVLRRLSADARRREGRVITFAELAARLRREMEERACKDQRLRSAETEILDAMRARRLTARGKRAPIDSAAPPAVFEVVPFEVLIEPSISISSEDRLVPGAPDHPYRAGNGFAYSGLRFEKAEVQALWPLRPELPCLDAPQRATGSALLTYGSGVAGRPTSAHLVERELRRRAESGEVHDSLAAEARALAEWLRAAHPDWPHMTPRTIENRIRDVHRTAKAKSTK